MRRLLGVTAAVVLAVSSISTFPEASAATGAAPVVAAPGPYTVTELPGVGGRALATNSAGHVVGMASVNNVESAVLWRNGVMTVLGPGEARSINDNGQVVGYLTSSGLPRAFLWQNNAFIDLGTLPGGTFSWANSINNRGQVVGDSDTSVESSPGALHAFLSQNNTMQRLPDSSGQGFDSRAYAINDDGLVVGQSVHFSGSGPNDGNFHAVAWSNGAMRDLGTLNSPYPDESVARAVNAAGDIVGSATDPNCPAPVGPRHCRRSTTQLQRPFLNRGGVMTNLGILGYDGVPVTTDDGTWSTASAINSRGQIVGFGGNSEPFVWQSDTGLISLRTLTPPTLFIRSVTAINDAGQIVGDAYFSNSDRYGAFILTPPAPSDLTPPVTTAAVTAGTAGKLGWYTSPVTVLLTAVDNPSGSGVQSLTYSLSGAQSSQPATVNGSAASVTISLDGVTTISFSARDNANNVEVGRGFVVKLDRTPPVVTYSGNAGSYTADQTVAITCQAADTVSTVATTTCANINGPAYTFAVGPNTFTATATDMAGNVGSGSAVFTVSVTGSSVVNVIQQIVTSQGDAAALSAQANGIATETNSNAKAGKLKAFENYVNAQTGKSITPANAAILLRLARAL